MQKIFIALFAALLFVVAQAQDCKHARILGSTWGTTDITAKVAHSYNIGARSWKVDVATLGETSPAVGRHITVVYEICQNIATVTAKEGDTLTLP